MDLPDAAEKFQRAVQIYLDFAYGEAPLSKRVQKHLSFPSTGSLTQLLHCGLFEVSDTDEEIDDNARYRLRLGNYRYPHMKLAVEWDEGDHKAIFSVETHDQHISAPQDPEEMAELEELQQFNEQLKHAIENAWREAGLPTFCEEILASSNGQLGKVNGRPMILLVEDEVDILDAERQLLECGGYRVSACPNATRALDELAQGLRPDLCVLDIMLPDIDGFELRDGIRNRLGPSVPIMFVTGLPTKALRERGELVLEKPFSGEELLKTVNYAMNRKP